MERLFQNDPDFAELHRRDRENRTTSLARVDRKEAKLAGCATELYRTVNKKCDDRELDMFN